MKILLINHYAGSPEMGMEFRPYYFAREWQKTGHEALIVGATYSHLRKKQPENSGSQTIDGINYHWIKTNVYSGNGVKRVISMFLFVLKLLFNYKKICKTFVPDVVVASSTYPLDNYTARRIAKHYKAKFIYEIHDLWPLSPMELGGMSKHHPFIVMMQMAENYAYKHVDAVISILLKADEHTFAHGLPRNKFYCVPNGIVVDDWNNPKPLPEEHAQLITKLKSENKFLVGFAGAHGIANSLYSAISAVKNLENVALVLVGNGQEKDNLIKFAKENHIENVYFLPPIDKLAIPSLLSKFDCLYVGLQKQSLFRFGISPNKIFDYMMASKPIIQAIDAGNNLVAEANCGISVEPDNTEKIAEAICSLSSLSQNEREILGKNGYNFVNQHHTYKILAKNFIEILESL